MKVKYISGWILKFFGYLSERDNTTGKLKIFNKEKIEIDDFRKLSYQMIKIPVKIIDEINKKEFDAKYEVGFIGCDKNEKNEIFPVKGWIFSILNKKQNEEEKKEEKNKIEEKKKDSSKEEDEEIENAEELKKMYKEMEEDEDKYDNINYYYLSRIKFPHMFKNIDEFEQEEEEEEEQQQPNLEGKKKGDQLSFKTATRSKSSPPATACLKIAQNEN